MKNALMWFYYSWDSIMNAKYNPLSYIKNISLQMYFMIMLSIIWTASFCGLIAGWANVIPLIYGHIGVLFAIFMTYGGSRTQRKLDLLGMISGLLSMP